MWLEQFLIRDFHEQVYAVRKALLASKSLSGWVSDNFVCLGSRGSASAAPPPGLSTLSPAQDLRFSTGVPYEMLDMFLT